MRKFGTDLATTKQHMPQTSQEVAVRQTFMDLNSLSKANEFRKFPKGFGNFP